MIWRMDGRYLRVLLSSLRDMRLLGQTSSMVSVPPIYVLSRLLIEIAEATARELSLLPEPASVSSHRWDYKTLSDSPPLHPDAKRWSSTMYHGIVPARNIARRDFAVNGAVVRFRVIASRCLTSLNPRSRYLLTLDTRPKSRHTGSPRTSSVTICVFPHLLKRPSQIRRATRHG